jgi:MscS family membrane protein
MTSMSRRMAWGTLLALLILSNRVVAQQPTIKEMIEKPDGGKPAAAKPAPEPPQPEAAKPETKPVQVVLPDDDFNRGSPRSSVEGFLAATRERDFERAAHYLDLSNLPWGVSHNGAQLARHLKIVLDRTLWVDPDRLSPVPKGHPEDGLPPYQDLVGQIDMEPKPINILLQRVPGNDRVLIWKFAADTVANIPELYEAFGYGYLGEILPPVFFDFEVLGLQVWWWIALVVVALLAYLLALLVIQVITFVVRRRQTLPTQHLVQLITGPGRFLLFVLLLRAGIDFLVPSVAIKALLHTGTILIIAVVWTAWCLFDLWSDRLDQRLRRRDQEAATVFLRPAKNALRVVTLSVAVIVWLDNIGFEVTTLLAGLGVGGIAVALAAQKSLENLLGGITLYVSQPVRVGDFCRFGDTVGTVEEIGLRATKVRTLDRTMLHIANAEFVNLHLDNFAQRDKIWYHPRIRLTYETTPDQLRYILVEIRKMLYAHPKVLADPARIRFAEFGAYSLDLEVFAYVDVTDFDEFLEIAEDLNLRMMDIVAQAGASLALPSQTTYFERGAKRDEQRARAAEAEVEAWRAQQALYLPRFPEEKIAALTGSLPYPPPGSASASYPIGKDGAVSPG